MKKINRILICSSPLQVINTRSAMDYIGNINKYNDYVIITHPLLTNKAKDSIRSFSKNLGFKEVFDFTSLFNDNVSNVPRLTFSKKLFNLKKYFNKKINYNEKIVNEIINKLSSRIGLVSSLFFRVNYNYYESIIIDFYKDLELYGIEDGFVDYIPENWAFKKFNYYEINHIIRTKLTSGALFLLSVIFTRKVSLSRVQFMRPKYKLMNQFTNISTNKSVCVKSFFKKNISKLLNPSKYKKNIKIMIIGTLLDNRFKFNLYDETLIYNKTISQIKIRHKVSNNEIWYKPHPRLDYESWQYKKNNLKCSIYNYNNNEISDIEMLNQKIDAVYSVGSTSLIYAKEIFEISSYWIDISKENCHPSAFKKASYLSKKFQINRENLN